MATQNGAPAAEKPVIDRAYLEANHADIVQSILNDGHKAGAEAERQRIKDIEAQAMPGHEALISEIKFDGKTTGPEAAVRILQAEKATRGKKLEDIRADAPNAIKPGQIDEPTSDDHLPIDERCKAKWEKDEKVRSEFPTLAAYTAYEKAAAAGRVKILGKKSA